MALDGFPYDLREILIGGGDAEGRFEFSVSEGPAGTVALCVAGAGLLWDLPRETALRLAAALVAVAVPPGPHDGVITGHRRE